MNEEMLDVVDEDDNFVRKTTREEVRQKALLHRSARVIILNSSGQFLVQKRSKQKDIYPGLWDIGVAETVTSGESYESAAMRGLLEEVGIKGISNIHLIHSFLFKFKFRSAEDNDNCKVYELIYDGKITPDLVEVMEIKFMPEEAVLKLIDQGLFVPDGTMAFKKYLEMKNGD